MRFEADWETAKAIMDKISTLHIKGQPIPTREADEAIGVPQRAYAFGDLLVTSNVNYCVVIAGYGNGCFLAHLDKYTMETPELAKRMIERIDFPHVIMIKNKGNDERQQWAGTLAERLKNVEVIEKSPIQSLNIGVNEDGLFHHQSTTTNTASDELEDWFYMRRGEGNAPKGYHRERLCCLNDAEGAIIPPEAFDTESLEGYQFLSSGEITREQMLQNAERLFGITRKPYLELAKGRKYGACEEQGALVIID